MVSGVKCSARVEYYLACENSCVMSSLALVFPKSEFQNVLSQHITEYWSLRPVKPLQTCLFSSLYLYCNQVIYSLSFLLTLTSFVSPFFLLQEKNPTSALMKAAANVTPTLVTASNTPAPITLTSLTTARWQAA